MRAVTNNHHELPPMHMGRSVDQFLYSAESSQGGKVLPNWKGELYLEFHRGTYIARIGSINKGNRHSEILLRDVEMVAAMASLSGRKYVYPKQKINEAWETVLLNQFNDLRSGMVYDDAEKLYAEVREACEEIIDDALDVILGGHTQRLGAAAAAAVTDLDQLVAYNMTPFSRCDVVQVPLPAGNSALRTQVAQLAADGKIGDGGVGALACPSWAMYTNGGDHFVLRNASMQLTISRGRTTSLLDAQLGRGLIREGATGGLDVEIHHLEKATQVELTKVSVVAQGPLRAYAEAEVVYGQSRINVTISLDAVPSPRIDSRSMFRFDACVDWHQRHEFLKFELLAINSDNATYETQFGWFEVCGHKLTDLSDTVSHAKEISCASPYFEPPRSPTQSRTRASTLLLGRHAAQGPFRRVKRILFGVPLQFSAPYPCPYPRWLCDRSELHSSFGFVAQPNVIPETMKHGEDDSFTANGRNTVVVRFYEAFGGQGRGQLRINNELDVEAAYETNLLEDIADGTMLALRPNGPVNEIDLSFRGFEVKTLVLVLREKKRKAEKRESWVTIDA
ncbi:galactose mutarotase-like domain-containing protein [Mycena sanguinolenta]|nr:galactose mutarotase-like domain-containing protein [Mycena sanguinolenta]